MRNNLVKKLGLSLAFLGLFNLNVSNSAKNLISVEEFYRLKNHYENVIKEYGSNTNKIDKRNDMDIWGIKDFWQTPSETDLLGTGDCEDVAISDYYNLRNRGGLNIKLLLCEGDISLKTNHICNTYSIGDSIYILDNFPRRIIKRDNSNYKNYEPFRLTLGKIKRIKDFEERSGINLEFVNKPTSTH